VSVKRKLDLARAGLLPTPPDPPTPRFHTKLQAEKQNGGWRLITSLRYVSALTPGWIVVPPGFETDFASVPRLPLAYLVAGNTAHAPAVVHDYLYRMSTVSRQLADAIFYEAMVVDGVSRWRAYLMWAAVRAFGAGSYGP
jgi:hypothetical protein